MLPSDEDFSAFKMSVSSVLRLKIRDDISVFKSSFKFARDLLFPKLIFSELIIIECNAVVIVVFYSGYLELCSVYR